MDEITELEHRAFWAANSEIVPPVAQQVVQDLWREVCRLENELRKACDLLIAE